MSDIKGEGWGSDHSWNRDITDDFGGYSGTRYFCAACGWCFVHRYDMVPDIFDAMMRYENVPETCEKRVDK